MLAKKFNLDATPAAIFAVLAIFVTFSVSAVATLVTEPYHISNERKSVWPEDITIVKGKRFDDLGRLYDVSGHGLYREDLTPERLVKKSAFKDKWTVLFVGPNAQSINGKGANHKPTIWRHQDETIAFMQALGNLRIHKSADGDFLGKHFEYANLKIVVHPGISAFNSRHAPNPTIEAMCQPVTCADKLFFLGKYGAGVTLDQHYYPNVKWYTNLRFNTLGLDPSVNHPLTAPMAIIVAPDLTTMTFVNGEGKNVLPHPKIISETVIALKKEGK